MDHLLALLPYNFFQETFESILKSFEESNFKISIASRVEDFEYEKYPYIKHNIYIDDENMILKDEKLFFEKLDSFYKANPFTGVINFFEAYVELAAKITERYSLHGNSYHTAIATRNKYVMRKVLFEHNILVPRFEIVYTLSEFEDAVKKIGYPCISKPIDGASSEGVVKLSKESSLKDIYEHSYSNNTGSDSLDKKGILVESFIDGPEFSVEAIVSDGKLSIMGTTAKTTEEEPFFNEIMHIHPAKLSVDTEEELNRLTKETIEALNIINGGIHLEVRIAPDGIYVMECASRLGGDAIQSLISLAKGYNPYYHLIQSGLNKPINIKASRNKYAGIRFIQTDQEGILKHASFNEEELMKISGIINKRVVSKIGEKVARPPKANTNRIGYVMAVGREYEEVVSKLEAAEKTLTYTLE